MNQQQIVREFTQVDELQKLIQQFIIPQLFQVRVILLYGEMGLGKTEYVRQLMQQFETDLSIEVSSPTYAIHNQYILKNNKYGFNRVEHLDLYRLNTPDDLVSIGFSEMLSPDSLVIVEWSERLDQMGIELSQNYLKIKFEWHSKEVRRLTIEKN